MRQLIIIISFFTVISFYGQLGPVPDFFSIQRELPLLDLTTTTTISVSSFGAVINDGNEDSVAITNAINAAINQASEQNPVKLLFENGTYDLMPDGNNSHSLQINDANHILWDGQGAEFIVHDPTVGFLSLLRCTNVIIKDISVDYNTLPFSQGVVTNVDVANGSFDFVVDDGFPVPTTSQFMDAPQRWGMIKNVNGSLKKGTRNLIPHNSFFQLIAPNTYRYTQNADVINTVDVGDYFVHIARYNGRTIISNNGGKNLTYLNVIGYASPAGGFNARNSEEWNVINSQIKLKPGRVHSINADVMHVNGGKIAPWVENCLFEGFSDDCMNLKYSKRVITTINSPTQLTVQNEVLVGENMEFYNPIAGTNLGEATVTDVQNLGGNLYKITLSNPINITNITNPDHQLADKAYIESQSNQSFIFRNNTVQNSRRYGLLIQSKYALIENNIFRNTSGSAIRIENGVDWGEGFRATDIVINNNTFENCGYDKTYIEEFNSATISVDFHKLSQPCAVSDGFCGTETANWQAHENIQITNNRIIYNKRGVFLKNINGLVLDNNFICHNGQDITLGSGESPIQQTIQNSSNTTVIDHNYELPTPNLHYVLNETSSSDPIMNTGIDSNIDLEVNTQGGTITQGYFDNEVGYSININTGGNGSLNLVDSSSGNSFSGPIGGASRTYAFWIKPAQGIFQNLLFSGGPTNGEVFAVQMLANGAVRVTDNAANTVIMNDMLLDIGSWNHVAITVPEGGTMFDVSLYKNGIPSTETFSGNNVRINTADNALTFFTRFNGVASDIRYFDYLLCNGDVESVYNDRYITLSTDEFNSIKDNIIVYPTVASNMVNFSKPITSVGVFDISGKIVFSKKDSAISNIDVSHLLSGLYLLKINKTQTSKFIKK
jgi:hypothetical protein